MTPALWTVGHSTRTQEDFLSLAGAHGIRAIADVRRFPGSRRHPHFARDAMARWLPAHGIDYVHVEALGGRRAAAADSPNTGLRNASFRGYADYMRTEAFEAALAGVIDLSRAQPTALMCAEAVWWRCHRSLIADLLTARGFEVRHILDASTPRPHRIHESARIDGRTVCYPSLL